MKKSLLCASLLLLAAGTAALAYQFMQGLGATGVNNGSSWGLYIICFMFTEGIGSGAMAVTSIILLLNLTNYQPLVQPAALTAVISMGLAQTFLGIDLGNPLNAYHMFLSPNLSSPMVWDFISISLFMIASLALLYGLIRQNDYVLKRSLLPALILSILVPSVSAWLFGSLPAHESWHSAIIAPLFVVSSLDSGLAVVLLLGLLSKNSSFIQKHTDLDSIARVLFLLILTDAFLLLCELVNTAYINSPTGNAMLAELFYGHTAIYFWGELLLEIILPAAILINVNLRQQKNVLILVALCVIMGVFCKRAWILLTAYLAFNLAGAPGIIHGASAVAGQQGSSIWALKGIYQPTFIEILIAAAVLTTGLLLYNLAQKYLPITRKESL